MQARRTACGGCRGASPYTARLVTRRPMFGCLFEIVETLVLTLIIFLVIQTFVAQPYKVQQQSMEHTLEPDQYVLVDKLTPRFDTYKRGDIVVFTPPARLGRSEDETPFIKRVIGLGGDTVEIRDGERLHQRDRARRAVPVRRRARRSAATDDRPRRRAPLGDPDRRAVPDGRPPLEFGRLAHVRPGARRGRSSVVPGCATGRSTSSGSSRRRPTRSWRRRRHEPPGVNPALAGGRARGHRRSRRGRVRPERAHGDPRSGGDDGRRAAPGRSRPPRHSAWPPGSSARSWPATSCGSRTRGHGVRTGGTLVGWPTEAFLATGRGGRRLRRATGWAPRRSARRSPRPPGSRWRHWRSCRCSTAATSCASASASCCC